MFRHPTLTMFRDGGINFLGDLSHSVMPTARKALLVTDKGIWNHKEAHYKSVITKNFQSNNIHLSVFDSVECNPRTTTVHRIADQARKEKCDLILGFGGGSVIDASKVAAVLCTNPCDDIRTLEGLAHFEHLSLPFLAVPSTCGSGSEVTWSSTLTDEENRRKISIKGNAMYPNVAIIDSDLLKSLPGELIAYTGMDALTHSIETIIGHRNNPISNTLAIQSIDLILDNLPKAVYKINGDFHVRTYMAQASTMAGMAFSNSDVGAVHCLSQTLGGMFDIPHGMLNASLLISVLKHHQPRIRTTLGNLFRQLNCERKMLFQLLTNECGSKFLAPLAKDDLFILLLNRLRSEIKIPSFSSIMKQYGITSDHFGSIAEASVQNESNDNNPQNMTAANYLKILEEAQKEEIVYIKSACHCDH